jgi:hypothetical protein
MIVVRSRMLMLAFSTVLTAVGCGEGSVLDQADEGAAEGARQDEAFWRQAADFDRQTLEVERQQKKGREQSARYDALLDRWEAQAERMDAVLDSLQQRAKE